jgi:hypothetical protein
LKSRGSTEPILCSLSGLRARYWFLARVPRGRTQSPCGLPPTPLRGTPELRFSSVTCGPCPEADGRFRYVDHTYPFQFPFQRKNNKRSYTHSSAISPAANGFARSLPSRKSVKTCSILSDVSGVIKASSQHLHTSAGMFLITNRPSPTLTLISVWPFLSSPPQIGHIPVIF